MNEEDLNRYLPAYQDGFQYSLDCDLMLNWYPERILAMAPQGESLLELGIGHGFTSEKFSERFSRHVIIEGSRQIIKQFEKNCSNISGLEIIHGFFEEFSTTERFDVIVMGFVLEHVDNDDLVFSHIARFLKPGGRIYLSVPNGQSLHRRLAVQAGMLHDHFELGPGDIAMGHKRLFTVDSLEALVEKHGFKVSKMEGIFLKPFTTEQIEALNLPDKILMAMMEEGKDYPELCSGFLAEVVEKSR